MKCELCGADNPDGAKECGACCCLFVTANPYWIVKENDPARAKNPPADVGDGIEWTRIVEEPEPDAIITKETK